MKEKVEKYHLPCFEESNLPWLMYTHGSSKHKQVQTLCSISGNKDNPYSSHLIKSIPELRHKSIVASIHDRLILRDSVRPELFSIFNPFTLRTLLLPPLHPPPPDDDDILCGLNSSPDDNTRHCVLLIFFTEANLMYSCRPTDPNCSWVTRPVQLHGSDSKLSELFTLNGVMYVSNSECMSDKLFYCVDEIESSSSLILRPLQIREPDVIQALFTMPFFLESCNRVYLVAVSSYSVNNLDLEHVQVFELDFVECCWKKINTLNGRTFFVGFQSCTWCWGTTDEFGSGGGILRDSVYIYCPSVTRLPLNVYNLYHGSLLPLGPCPNNTLSYKQHGAVWVIPQQLRSEPMIRQRAVQTNTECQELESKFNILPLHLVEKISQHMHLFEYCNFRATSKTFRSMCPAPRWKTANNVLPALLLHFDNGGSRRLIDPFRQGSVSHVVPFFPDPFVIRYSKNGWVLALVGKSLQYFNLFTGVKGEYPKPHNGKDEIYFFMKGIAFSTYPTCSECLTIGTLGNDDGAVIVYYESGKETWNYYGLEFEGGNSTFWPSTSCPIFLAGAFYILGVQGHLCVFQLVNGEGSCRMYAKPQTLNNFSASHLVESEGQLYSVFIDKMGQCVQIFRFDNAIKSWVGVDSLENHVFFISPPSSFSVVTRDRRMRNRIYLPRLYKKGLVFYCQDTKKYHSSTSDDFIDNFFGTYELLHCCWI